MGPQHDSCGRRRRHPRHLNNLYASMGPQHDSCGRERGPACAAELRPASMGPQHDSCGRKRVVRAGLWRAAELQWGRNMIVAEGSLGHALTHDVHASMGPQHDSCGRGTPRANSRIYCRLQWGRNMIVAEGVGPWFVTLFWGVLQWGRNMIVAEGRKSWTSGTTFTGFNGAAT